MPYGAALTADQPESLLVRPVFVRVTISTQVCLALIVSVFKASAWRCHTSQAVL